LPDAADPNGSLAYVNILYDYTCENNSKPAAIVKNFIFFSIWKDYVIINF
jgi:hypothetical protein